MLSRPIYNFVHPTESSSTKYIGSKSPGELLETGSSNIKRTTGNTGK